MSKLLPAICILTGSLLIAACNSSSDGSSVADQDAVASRIEATKNKGKKVEGRFIDLVFISGNSYELSVQLNKDSIAVFQTVMPLSEDEIQMLKKQGNNITLIYDEYQEVNTKKLIRSVTHMEPVYEFK